MPSFHTTPQKRARAHRYATVEKGAAIKVVAKRVKATLDALKPRSALVFLTDSSGLAVRDAVAELRNAGVAADPLHEALQIDKDAAKKRADGPTDLGEVLEGGHARVAATFRDATVDEAPVLVTFETSARGGRAGIWFRDARYRPHACVKRAAPVF